MVSELFLNQSGAFAGVVNGMAELTGNYFSAMLLIIIILILACLAMRLPLEVSVIFVLPFILVCYAFIPDFVAVTGVFLIYMGIVLAKNFFLK